MVRAKVNRFTIQQDNPLLINSSATAYSNKNNNNSNGSHLDGHRLSPPALTNRMGLSSNNRQMNTREPAFTIRRKVCKKESENKRQTTYDNLQSHHHQAEREHQMPDFSEKKHNQSDMSLEFTCNIPQKKSNRQKCQNSLGYRPKQRYYIINEQGMGAQDKQAKAFSDESLECMEIMKAAISDVVHDKVSQITESRFECINKRLDNIALMIQKNEVAIADCVKELRSKLKHYGEDSSRHLKYLCMKLEYEKLISQNFNTLLASDLSQQRTSRQSTNCIHKVVSGFCTQRQQSNHYQPSCCCHSTVCGKSSSDECVCYINNNNTTRSPNEKPVRLVRNMQADESIGNASEKQIKDDDFNDITLPNLLNNFIKYKLNNSKNQMPSPPADGQNVPITNNSENPQIVPSELGLKDILDTIGKYYPPPSKAPSISHGKSDVDLKEDDEDGPSTEGTEESEEYKNSVDDSEDNYCHRN